MGRYIDVKADRIQADVKMFTWQRAKATKEWKQQLLEVWPVKKLRSGRFNLNVVAELRNGEWLITKQDYLSESMSLSNSQMQAQMAFQKLMCSRYEHWDNCDIVSYSKSLAHDVEMVLGVKYQGKKDVTNMVTKEWKQQLMQIWPAKQLRSGRFTLNATAELRNGEWLITQQEYSSED